MKKFFRDPISSLGVAAAAGILAAVSFPLQAKAELIYEDGTPAQGNNRIEERGTMREVMSASEKAQTTVQAQPVVIQAPAAIPTVQVTNTSNSVARSSSANETEVTNTSKSELMRRARMREEVKNEDILQERLEELRLRDEQRRTNQVLGGQLSNTGQAAGYVGVSANTLQEQPVVAPITEHPGVIVGAPVSVGTVNETRNYGVGESRSTLTTSVGDSGTEGFSTAVTVMPRFGVGSMQGAQGFYDVRPRFATGIGMAVATSENLSIEAGYLYGEYGVAVGSSSPYIAQMAQYGYNPSGETQALKQNVFDLGLKVHFTGTESRIRPFIGGGGGYSKSYVNYDERILSALRQNPYFANGLSTDYDVSSYLGYLSAGLDVRMSKSISLGLLFRYYTVLSARENGSLNPYAMYGYNNLAGPGYYSAVQGPQIDPDKQAVGGSLARSAFYTLLAGVNFTF